MRPRGSAVARRRLAFGAAVACALVGGVAHAGDALEQRLNEVEFQVAVERPVENDLARAVVAVERENVDPATLAQDVNRAMTAALRAAREAPGVDVRSGEYRTSPVHDQHRIVRWRASQELILESAEPEALHRLLGSLQQEALLLRSLGYTVSAERRQEVEAALVTEALAAFRERARLVSEGLGAGDYDIVRLHLHGEGTRPPAPAFTRLMAAESAPVAGEPGTSRLHFGVDAVIRLRD